MGNFKVSVIVPVFNASRYIEMCLDSIRKQTLKELEIICVDDGSTDGSREILNAYSCKYEKVRVLTQPNLFAGTARNNGLLVARGDYIAFLDADDWLLPDALAELYSVARKHDLEMVKGCFYNYDNVSGRIFTTDYSVNYGVKRQNRNKILSFYDGVPEQMLCIADSPCNGLYKRSFLIENHIRFNNLKCCNDHSFFLTCLIKAKRVMVVDTFIFYCRTNQKNSLVGIRWKNYSDVLASYSLVKKADRNLPEKLFHLVMQKELKYVLFWYKLFKGTVEDIAVTHKMEEQLKTFFSNYDKKDVTPSFLRNELNALENSFLHEIVSPELSVIMPVRNAEKSIRYMLYSLQKQSFTDYEVICINDASTDRSFAILEEYAKKDYRIRIINNIKDLNAGVSRDLAMQLARGTYIVFLDAVDILRDDALEQFYAKAQDTDDECIACQMYNANEVLDFNLQTQYLFLAALNDVKNNTRLPDIGYMKWRFEDVVLTNLNSCKGGRIVLFSLQKLPNVIRCWQGYGFVFTLNRAIERVKSDKNLFKNI